MSPTVLQSGPYRFFFFSSDRHAPVHVHVSRDKKTAKFWLSPTRLANNYGFTTVELQRIETLALRHEQQLVRAWHEYFHRGE